MNSEKDINIIQNKIRKVICKNSDSFIASSTKTKEAQIYYGADSQKIFISFLTVDIDKYLIQKNIYGNLNLLYVGSLIKRKGLDLLFYALKDVINPFKLTIIGEGIEENALKELATKLGIMRNIEFYGYKNRKELIEFYRIADIFILPTIQDCFGLVITEAMCAGLPVIVSKYADGAYDLVNNGINGLIIDPYNTKEFTKSIEMLLTDPMKIEQMSKQAYVKLNNFSISEVAKEFKNAIEYLYI